MGNVIFYWVDFNSVEGIVNFETTMVSFEYSEVWKKLWSL